MAVRFTRSEFQGKRTVAVVASLVSHTELQSDHGEQCVEYYRIKTKRFHVKATPISIFA